MLLKQGRHAAQPCWLLPHQCDLAGICGRQAWVGANAAEAGWDAAQPCSLTLRGASLGTLAAEHASRSSRSLGTTTATCSRQIQTQGRPHVELLT